VEYLEPYFSQNISIKRGKNGGGKIVIDFASDSDIEQYIARLSKKN
jgi:ParB family chromosome partitioning protein